MKEIVKQKVSRFSWTTADTNDSTSVQLNNNTSVITLRRLSEQPVSIFSWSSMEDYIDSEKETITIAYKPSPNPDK